VIDLHLLAAILAFAVSAPTAVVCGYLGIRGLIREWRGEEDDMSWTAPIMALIIVGYVVYLTNFAGQS
jgi:hypothetical protein